MTLETKHGQDAELETYPVPDPGLEHHVERYTDANPAAADRAYKQVVGMLGLVPVLAIAFVVIYFAVARDAYVAIFGYRFQAHTLLLGLTGGLGALLIGMALIHWARTLMSDEEMTEPRHTMASPQADREAIIEDLTWGVEKSGVARRSLMMKGLLGGIGIMAIPAVVTLADMGPWPTGDVRARTIEKTIWAPGIHLVNDITKKKLKASDIEIGQLVNAQPENLWTFEGTEFQQQKAKAALIIVRMDPASIKIPASRQDWQVGGILAYSKICTHVGCPISLWEQQTHHLLCPCHQSTFDLGDSGLVVFGPAARALPQLPITTDAEGYLIAKSDFTVPVGPSYFERDSTRDFKEGDR